MKKPWVMTQEWHDVLFLHWQMAPQLVQPHIPSELQLDLYDGHAWVSIVSFKAKHTRPRLLPPIPIAGTYLELNVRTYVKYKGKSGVFFFSLDADSPLAVKAASAGNFLPYLHARMMMVNQGGICRFKSKRTSRNSFPETLDLSFKVTSSIPKKSALEEWLTERYCLWTKPKKQLIRVDIEHSPWQLSYVKGTIYRNTMANFLGFSFPQEQAFSHYSEKKKVRFFPPVGEKH